MQTYTLNSGYTVPKIGFGTWEITPDHEAKKAVLTAIEAGYRLIDTAKIYGNEKGVGEAIRESGIPREDIFVTTKLWNDDQGYDSALKACQASLEKLGLDYLDLYLIHWPATSKRGDSWRAFERLINEDMIRSAGVSNYTVEHLEELCAASELKPAVNQIELHPLNYDQQSKVLDYCAAQHILIEAYSPIKKLVAGHAAYERVARIGKYYKRTPQQVLLRWCIEQGTVPLPRSSDPAHIKENIDIFDFQLSADAMDLLDSLNGGTTSPWEKDSLGL
jgi:diketogulonate reductase-like aldo/keto reductase